MAINLLLALGLGSAEEADDPAMQNSIRARQWQELVSKLPSVFGGQLVAGTTFLALAHSSIAAKPMGLWLLCFALSIASNVWWYLRHSRLPLPNPDGQRESIFISACIVLQAAVWGVGLAMMLPPNSTLQLQSLVLLIAVLSGAPFALSSHFPTLVGFSVMLILPMGVHFMGSSDPQIRILGLASVPCLLMFLLAGRALNRHLIDSYRTLEQVQGLVLDLEHEKIVIRDALGQAEKANSAKSRFLAGASHDLRQPLQAIGLTVSSLRREPLAEKRSVLFENLSRSVDRLDRLFNRLLDISRLDAGKVQSNPVWVSSGEVLQSLQEQFSAIAEQRHLDLRFFDAARCMVHTDPDLLEQLLGNLISNALRYTVAGGVLVGARRLQGNLLLQVWDTGVGIDANRYDTIFEEFVQLDNSNHTQTRGLGLGLAISRRISLVLGARLTVRARPMKGSVFELAMPGATGIDPQKLARPHAGMPVTDDAVSSELAGVNLLVVDDEPDILMGLSATLSASDCYVNTTTNLAQTQLWLNETERLPDALIVDFRLANGETAWDIVNATLNACDNLLAVVICSGEINAELEAQAHQRGFTLLRKPVSATVLEGELATALKTLNLQRLNRQLEPGASQ